jgi:hypothetical protein
MNQRRIILEQEFWKLSRDINNTKNKIEGFLCYVPFHWNHINEMLTGFLAANQALDDMLEELRTVERRPSFIS